MSKYAVTSGIQTAPVKTVLYGPEGIGKSTFASHFPSPVFIDTEGGTKRLNVARLPQPTSWAMLLDEVAEVRKGSVPCGTLVLDTADWAERLCIQAVCARAKVNGIEDFGYGKGYTYVKEEFAKLLDALEEVLNAGHNVVVLAPTPRTRPAAAAGCCTPPITPAGTPKTALACRRSCPLTTHPLQPASPEAVPQRLPPRGSCHRR